MSLNETSLFVSYVSALFTVKNECVDNNNGFVNKVVAYVKWFVFNYLSATWYK